MADLAHGCTSWFREIVANSALRLNTGDFYVMPSIGASKSIFTTKIGNVRYLNYALQSPDVAKLFKRGPPSKQAFLDDTGTAEPICQDLTEEENGESCLISPVQSFGCIRGQ